MSQEVLVNKSDYFLEATEQYLLVIASCLAKNLDSKKEPILSSVVKKFTYVNPYESGNRPKPGSFKIFGDGLKRRYVIVIYSQLYPSKADYPRDNKKKRLEWFADALNEIAELEDLKSLCFPSQVARDGGGNWSDYYMTISDFAQTLQLNCNIPIVLYDNPDETSSSNHDTMTQISLINCINLDTSIGLDKLVFAVNQNELVVDREKLSLVKPKQKLHVDMDKLKESVNHGKKLVLEDSDDEALPEKKIELKKKITFKKKTPEPSEAEPEEPEEKQKAELPDFPVTKLNPDWKTPFTKPNVHKSWNHIFERVDMQKKLTVTHKLLVEELRKYGDTKRFLPAFDSIFKTFQLCTWDDLKVVILGQDPYPNPDHAMGLSFSVPKGNKIAGSLTNIFKELKNEYGDDYQIPKHGDLTSWVEQGVLLLNSALTIRGNDRNSHQNYWRDVTALIIELISKLKEKPVIFILWGGDARKNAKLIDKKHLILEAAHPSGLSAHRGFFGCNHFKICNKKLTSSGMDAIKWQT